MINNRNNPVTLQTYQFAANAPGTFVADLPKSKTGAHTLIAATGDHNARMHDEQDARHHSYRVPLLFRLPPEMKAALTAGGYQPQPRAWTGHRDLFPTITALALHQTSAPHEGCNLYAAPADLRDAPASSVQSFSLTFTRLGKNGTALCDDGAVALNSETDLTCYRFDADSLMPGECTETLRKVGAAARAQRALAEYTVRRGLSLKAD